MATFVAIPEKTQSATAMKKVTQYVMQEKKTLYYNEQTEQSYQLISGQNCTAETAYREFMNTKKQYKKDNGVFFKQYVQSFKPDCGATPEQIHAMGVELAKSFEGFEVVIATHIDVDHWHNHFVVNSVNCETGLKIQINEKGLEQLRNRSDEICKQFGFEVLKPYQKPKQKAMSQREYRAALRGDSWKFQLLNCIDRAMKTSRSKQEFIKQMQDMGYQVNWQDSHKYITYTTPQGQKCRDNKLHDEKYLKVRMEEFYGFGKTQSTKQAGKSDRELSDTATILRTAARNAGAASYDVVSDSAGTSPHAGANQQAANMGQSVRNAKAPASGNRQQAGNPYQQQRSAYQTGNTKSNEQYESLVESDDSAENFGTGTIAQSARPIAVETAPEMGGNGSDVAVSVLGLAVAIENLVNPPKQNDDEQQKNTIPKQRKKQRKTHEKDWEMEM